MRDEHSAEAAAPTQGFVAELAAASGAAMAAPATAASSTTGFRVTAAGAAAPAVGAAAPAVAPSKSSDSALGKRQKK